jgi:TonB family protein
MDVRLSKPVESGITCHDAADIGDVIRRLRERDAVADFASVPKIFVLRVPQGGAVDSGSPPVAVNPADRFPLPYHRGRKEISVLLGCSLALHASSALLFQSEADVASIGQEVISVEIVIGAETAAGLTTQQTQEQPETEIASVEPKPEEPTPPLDRPEREEPSPEKEVRVVEKTEPPRQEQTAAAGGVGRGRSELSQSYQSRVAAHLARHKRFPPEARYRETQGRAVVSFSLNPHGVVTAVELVEGIGVVSLDQEATAMVRRASPFPAPPGGQSVSFTVPIRFKLQ